MEPAEVRTTTAEQGDSAPAPPPPPSGDGAIPVVPRLTIPALFAKFLRFGFMAWGGPVAQIAMIRGELVDDEHWISKERFNRALAVYQVLPGPEAHELCCYFGYLSRGRLGALIAGLGFMLPGFVLMLALSWLYMAAALGSALLLAAFAGVQPAVAALIVRATHRIGGHALHKDVWLWAIAVLACVAALLGVHFSLALIAGGLAFALARGKARVISAVILAALGAFVVWHVTQNPPDQPVLQEPTAERGTADWPELLGSGLKAGLLTFGGAYTVIPYLREDTVFAHGWLSDGQFLDGIGLAGVLPAPLVIFGTFVGFVAGGFVGALAMTLGIFAPAFAFTIVGHGLLERVVNYAPIHRFLDGVTAAVVGLIAAAAIQVTLATTGSVLAGVIFVASLVVLFRFKYKWVIPALVLAAGLVGGAAHVMAGG